MARRAIFDEIRSLAHGSIGAGYVAVGTALNNNARLIVIQNYTDTQMMFSIDGSVDHLTLRAGGEIVLDISANREPDEDIAMEKYDRLYVKQVAAPSSGSVYFSVIYV